MKQSDPKIGDTWLTRSNGSALQSYKREFSKMTNITGIIQAFPKGPLRKAECLKGLQDVELQPGREWAGGCDS